MNNNLNYPGQPKAARGKKNSSDLIWNVLTVVMLIGALCLAGYFVSLLQNPYSLLNPFPPPTAFPTPIPPTITPVALDATWTPTITVEPTITNTPRPTFTLEPSATLFTMATATSAFTPTKTPKPTGVPFSATVSYQDSTLFRTDTSCDVMLVAGQTMDAGNNPVIGLIVKLGGSLPGKVFNPPEVKLTGIATAYGPSGFEFNLGVKPVSSSNSLWVQLFDHGGAPLSNQLFLTTFKDCKKNLILIRFQQK